ncbi:helix-turn-helix domain-containing protein [Serratia proteamaculans]|uniref:helix-turn-helix domain-containing protein n=1 Tax=Serratia proteamaculans TaxID=28151 RepID=UPI0024B8C52B|nr:helix-turn-helix transcriptional regulator [Serratia proteamaculans]
MSSQALVELVLKNLACSQKALAERLGVSPAQVSKWKKGEYMSDDMEKKMRELSGINTLDPDLVLLVGSAEQAMKWEQVIQYIAETALENAETGYETEPLTDPDGLLCAETLRTLNEMGVTIPKEFPTELEVDFSDPDEDMDWDMIEENPYFSLISQIYRALNDVYGFYYAYIYELIYDNDDELFDVGSEIESCLLLLAASKVDTNNAFVTNFTMFKYRVTSDYGRWISQVKEIAFRKGYPLKAELLNLVYSSHDALGHEAEAESLGFNKSRLHPDVYMNELLVGMRTIHQILPAIMKKLGMEEEFELDITDLNIK